MLTPPRHIPFAVRKTMVKTAKAHSLSETTHGGLFGSKKHPPSPAKKNENEEAPDESNAIQLQEAEPVEEASPPQKNPKSTLEVRATSNTLKEFLESQTPLGPDLRPRSYVKLNIPFTKQKNRCVDPDCVTLVGRLLLT